MTLDALYYLLVGFFVTHELDAVGRHEWRMLPFIRSCPEKLAEQLFIWLHVPILTLLLVGGDGDWMTTVRIAFASFAIVHVGLHWVFRTHLANEFNTLSSWALILGTGATGAAYLVAVGMS